MWPIGRVLDLIEGSLVQIWRFTGGTLLCPLASLEDTSSASSWFINITGKLLTGM